MLQKGLIAISALFCTPLCTHTAHISFPCCERYFFSQQWAQESCHMVLLFLGKWARLKEDTVRAFPQRDWENSVQLTQLPLQALRNSFIENSKLAHSLMLHYALSCPTLSRSDKWYLAVDQNREMDKTDVQLIFSVILPGKRSLVWCSEESKACQRQHLCHFSRGMDLS